MVKGELRTPENAVKVVDHLRSGLSVCQTAKEMGCSDMAILLWKDEDPAFALEYARARQIGYELLADGLLAIADTPVQGEKVKVLPDGKTETTYGDMIEHRRLQVDTRKWMLSKMLPKVYGEKVDVQHSGDFVVKHLVGIDIEKDLLGKEDHGTAQQD